MYRGCPWIPHTWPCVIQERRLLAVDSGWVGLHLKHTICLAGESFISLGISVPWEGQYLQSQQGPKALVLR